MPCSLKSAASSELRRRRSRYLESNTLVGTIFLKARHTLSYLLRSHELYSSVLFQAVSFASNIQPVPTWWEWGAGKNVRALSKCVFHENTAKYFL